MSQDGQRDSKGQPQGAQGYSKGIQRRPKDAQREPKGFQNTQMEPKVGPGAAGGAPKEAKGKDIYQKTPDQPPKRTLC